jgi:hypothetical protein
MESISLAVFKIAQQSGTDREISISFHNEKGSYKQAHPHCKTQYDGYRSIQH